MLDHVVDLDKSYYHLLEKMQTWCKENIGVGGWIPHEYNRWELESMFGNSRFYFKSEKDAIWFKLRWI